MEAYLSPSIIDAAPYLAPGDAQTLNPAPTAVIVLQPAPSGQSQRFVLDVANATDASYTLVGQNGAANVGPVKFDISAGRADFTVLGTPPAVYAVLFSLVGPNGTAQIDGAPLRIIGVRGGSGVDTGGGGGGGGTTPPPVSTVTSVTVTPATAQLDGGGLVQFTATVAGLNNPSQAVTWSRFPAVGTLTAAGAFTVEPTDTEQVIAVTATSVQDITKFDTATVTVPKVAAAGTGFVRSKSRTIKVKAAPLTFEGSAFWDLRDPRHPVGSIDKDATIDITFDWSEVLADIGDAVAKVQFDIDGLTSRGGFSAGGFATIFVAEPNGQPRITCRLTTKSVPARTEDRTVFLKIEAE